MWFVYALGSAVFAALTSILAKIGIEGVNSTLATAIRTAVVLLMSWGMVFLTGTQTGIADISRRSWLFLVLSGLATGASWLCYYHALQIGAASKVVPIDKLSVVITLVLAFVFLHERFTPKSLIGCRAYRRGADASRGAACDPGAAVSAELCSGRHALCGGRGVDSGNVAGAALESWNGVLCGRLQRDDGAGCGAGISK